MNLPTNNFTFQNDTPTDLPPAPPTRTSSLSPAHGSDRSSQAPPPLPPRIGISPNMSDMSDNPFVVNGSDSDSICDSDEDDDDLEDFIINDDGGDDDDDEDEFENEFKKIIRNRPGVVDVDKDVMREEEENNLHLTSQMLQNKSHDERYSTVYTRV